LTRSGLFVIFASGDEMTTEKLLANICLAQQGDSDAWQNLLVTYRPVMERWASGIHTDSEMSQADLVQIAWMQAFKGLGKFKGVAQPRFVAPMFYQWLRITARNAMLTSVKRGKTQRRSPDRPLVNGHVAQLADQKQKTPSSIVARNEQLNRLAAAVDSVTDLFDKQIISMVFEDGLSMRSAAQLLGRDYSTVRRRFHALIHQLGMVIDG